MNTVKPPYKNGSPSHIALKYAAMKRTSVATVEGLLEIFPKRFEKPSRGIRSFEMLSRYGYVCPVAGGWKITQYGLAVLKESSEPYTGDKGFTRK